MEERKLSNRTKKEVIVNKLLTYNEHKGKTYKSLHFKSKPYLMSLLTQQDYDELKLLDVFVPKKGTGAKQAHGFLYEDKIINENDFIKSKDYTDKWDTTEKVSIKNIKYGTDVCLGDFFRQSQTCHDFVIYIGFWKGKKSNIVEEHKILVKKENWSRYFGNHIDEISLKKEMDGISNSYDDDAKWHTFMNKFKKSYGDAIVKLRFKRDHVDQKRVQCAINFTDFKNILIKENVLL